MTGDRADEDACSTCRLSGIGFGLAGETIDEDEEDEDGLRLFLRCSRCSRWSRWSIDKLLIPVGELPDCVRSEMRSLEEEVDDGE